MSDSPLIVAQHLLDAHPRRDVHWSLAMLQRPTEDATNAATAQIFELQGNPDTFHYETYSDDAFSKDPKLCGGCLVAWIAPDQVEQLKQQLRDVEVIRHQPDAFDCQDWVVSALSRMREWGYSVVTSGEGKIREELRAEYERWNVADDILPERIFQ